MELTPDELYSVYASLDEEMAAEKLPISLSEMYGALVSSMTLKTLGSEVIQTEHGEGLLVRGIPGAEPCILTASRALYERGVPGRQEPVRFTTWGVPEFEKVVKFIVSLRDDCSALDRCEVAVPQGGTVVRWSLQLDDGQQVPIERFGQLPGAVAETSVATAGQASSLAGRLLFGPIRC